MATFNYVLGRKKDNGKYPIALRITNKNSNTSLSLGMDVVKSEWNSKGQRVSIRRTDTYEVREEKKQINDSLDKLTIRVKEFENLLKQRGVLEEMTAAQIKKNLLEFNPHSDKPIGNGNFVHYWNVVAQRTPKSQTKYQYALKAIVNFQTTIYGKDTILFEDISIDWVAGCLAYLKEVYQYIARKKNQSMPQYRQITPQTLQSYVGCLKKVINCAIDSNRLPVEVLRGFRNFKANISVRPPYALNIEQLRELLHYPFKTMRQRMCRDLFFFSICTMGMNMEDIYFLQNKSVKWGDDSMSVSYVRHKTSKHIEIEIPHCAEHIRRLIEPYMPSPYNVWHYQGDTDYLLALRSNYSIYKTFNNNAQKIIRDIREIMGYDERFTFYTARDSWATIVSGDYLLGQEYVDAGLGHSSKSIAANHYISIDWPKLWDVQVDILHRLFEE